VRPTLLELPTCRTRDAASAETTSGSTVTGPFTPGHEPVSPSTIDQGDDLGRRVTASAAVVLGWDHHADPARPPTERNAGERRPQWLAQDVPNKADFVGLSPRLLSIGLSP
jgi:hypothetical protein